MLYYGTPCKTHFLTRATTSFSVKKSSLRWAEIFVQQKISRKEKVDQVNTKTHQSVKILKNVNKLT